MKAVMYGAGNIGRGFIGALLSQNGFEVVFVDVNQEVVDLMNQEGCYPQEIIGESDRTVWITNIRAVLGTDIEAVRDEISSADILAVSVGAAVLPKILPNIAMGLKKRWEYTTAPLDILICENLMHADQLVKYGLLDLLGEEYQEHLDKYVGFVETAIGRMVPLMDEERKKGNPLRICVEEYDYLPIDADALRSSILQSDKLIPYSPFSYYIERKLYMHNMAHEAIACLGKQLGLTYIEEAASDARIRLLVEHAIIEVCQMLHLRYQTDMGELLNHMADLIRRFRNPKLKDTVERVTRDPLRKLQPKDRMTGALRACESYGIQPVSLCALLAYVLLDANPTQPLQVMAETCQIQIEELCGQRIQMFLELINKDPKDLDTLIHKTDEMRKELGVMTI